MSIDSALVPILKNLKEQFKAANAQKFLFRMQHVRSGSTEPTGYLEAFFEAGSNRLDCNDQLKADTAEFFKSYFEEKPKAQTASLHIEIVPKRDPDIDYYPEALRPYPPEVPGQHKEPYGQELADKFYDLFLKNQGFNHTHRDYCGMGFVISEKEIMYGEILDGYLQPSSALKFSDKGAFVTWLAQQTDKSLSRDGETFYARNQTVTFDRLQNYVKVYSE